MDAAGQPAPFQEEEVELIDDWGFVVPESLRDVWLRILEARAHPDRLVKVARRLSDKPIEAVSEREVIGESVQCVFALCFWLGFDPTWQQALLLYAYQSGHKNIAVKSGHGVGKTRSSCILALHMTMRRRGALTLVNGPKMEQLKHGFLVDFKRMLEKAHPAIRKIAHVTKSKIVFGTQNDWQTWMILPVTASDARKIQGKHAEHLNLIVDEASGVDDEIFEALEGTASNVASEFTPDAEPATTVLFGNPNQAAGYFYECFEGPQSKDWIRITFNSEQSPIVNKARLERFARVFGKDSNFYRVRVLGEFPEGHANAIILEKHVRLCTTTDPRVCQQRSATQKVFAIDFARRGDECVVVVRHGGRVLKMHVMPQTADFEPEMAILWCFRAQERLRWSNDECLYVIDSVGMGQGLIYPITSTGRHVFEFGSNKAATAENSDKFTNQASEAWWQVSYLMKKGLIHIPDDPELHRQLITRRWKPDLDARGRICVESKKEWRRRMAGAGASDDSVGSPDRADALVMCFLQTLGGSIESFSF